MKVLLVIPHGTKQGPAFDIPTNMFYLMSSLRQVGIESELADGNLVGFSGVKSKIDDMKPDVVGISVLSPARFNALLIAQSAKDVGAQVVLGNHHATWMYKQILENYDYVDACALGEGEQTLVDFCTMPIGQVASIAFRSSDEVIVNKPKKHRELDDIPFPAWDLVDWQPYRAAGAIGPRMYYSRGCWGKCKFCTSPRFWRGYRHRSPQNFCDEAEWLFKLGQPECVFGDDNASNDDATALFEEIFRRKGKVCIPAVVVTRVDTVTTELCNLMARCGVQEVVYGIESFSQNMLDHFDKGTTVEQNRDAIRMAKNAGLKVCALIIRNSIGEERTDKDITENALRDFSPIGDGSVNALWLFPKSKYWDEVVDGKYDHLIKSGKEWVTEDFYLDPNYSQHVIEYRDGVIRPVRTTD
jgi:anaerobic magnesium-protoporphyrin IX monomethyl ester cyclase